ncbi:unnamed protein product [Toxocara canis]|uniref:Uncharacterized protein n=1 Tax=Toxocara canis TaxID=6265 RepID=A0A183UBE8_TOXCA|nr:unnamed protein product [Toxocara canis]
MKKDMAELTRRRIAATHKIERLEEEAKLLNENITEEKKKLDGFNEVLRKAEIRKDGVDKETQALNEAVIDDEEERQEKELIAKLEREEENVTSIRGENEFIEKNLKASREELEMWMKKVERIDNDELYAFDEARRNAILIETRRLKNLNSVLNRRIRETQKELEMCALRRDFVVGKAQTTISRRNHVRSQAIDRIEQLKSRIAELRKVAFMLLCTVHIRRK